VEAAVSISSPDFTHSANLRQSELTPPAPRAQNATTAEFCADSLGRSISPAWSGGFVEQQDVERIARVALKELGVIGADMKVGPVQGQPGNWRIDIGGTRGAHLKIKCGQGSSPQWVREQIFEQYLGQS